MAIGRANIGKQIKPDLGNEKKKRPRYRRGKATNKKPNQKKGR